MRLLTRSHTARRENIAYRRYTPEVGAVCLNWARTDLCGGREVTRVPTAIIRPFYPSSDRGEDIARGPVRLLPADA